MDGRTDDGQNTILIASPELRSTKFRVRVRSGELIKTVNFITMHTFHHQHYNQINCKFTIPKWSKRCTQYEKTSTSAQVYYQNCCVLTVWKGVCKIPTHPLSETAPEFFFMTYSFCLTSWSFPTLSLDFMFCNSLKDQENMFNLRHNVPYLTILNLYHDV